MGKQIEILEISAFLPDSLKLDLDILLGDVEESEMDLVIIIDGKEGAGKSYEARLIGKYCAYRLGTTFSPDNINFTTSDYINHSEGKPKYTVNVLDESREALNKRRGMSKSNIKFTNWLSENRDKQQIHIIVLPAVHDLDSYISIWRMKLLIHNIIGHIKDNDSKSGYKLIRGYFKVFENNNNLQQVIYNKAKYGYYAYPKYAKYQRKFRYSEVFTADEMQKYKEKKAKLRKEKYGEDNVQTKHELALQSLVANLKDQYGISTRELSKLSDGNLSHTIFSKLIRDNKETQNSKPETGLIV